MVDVDKIEDAIVTAVSGAGLGLKKVAPYEADYDQQQISQLLVLAPFVLVNYDGLEVDEDQRFQDMSVGVNSQDFTLYVGSQSLKDRQDAQRGCYTILRGLRTLFDGKVITADAKPLNIGLVREFFVSSQGGLIVYAATYRVFDL